MVIQTDVSVILGHHNGSLGRTRHSSGLERTPLLGQSSGAPLSGVAEVHRVNPWPVYVCKVPILVLLDGGDAFGQWVRERTGTPNDRARRFAPGGGLLGVVREHVRVEV